MHVHVVRTQFMLRRSNYQMALGKHSCEGTSHSYLLFMLEAIYTAKSALFYLRKNGSAER